jgi:hypothetical protein
MMATAAAPAAAAVAVDPCALELSLLLVVLLLLALCAGGRVFSTRILCFFRNRSRAAAAQHSTAPARLSCQLKSAKQEFGSC